MKLKPIDYLRIGREIGKHGYCGECIGCVCYRDFCDYADDLKEHDREKEAERRVSVTRRTKLILDPKTPHRRSATKPCRRKKR